MRLRKFWFLSLFIIFGCAGNPRFVKPASELSKQIKRLLILPVYADTTLFPQLPKELKEKEYPEAFRKGISTALQEKLPTIDQAIKDLLLQNTLGFEVLVGTREDLKILQLSPVKTGIYKNTGFSQKDVAYAWPFNRNWVPSQAGFQNLLKKYEADGILVQSITVNQIWYSYSWQEGARQYSIMMPFDTLYYLPAVYDRSGSIVYGGERIDCNYYMANKHCENVNGNRLVFLQRATAAEKKGYKSIPEDLSIVQKSISELTDQRIKSILSDSQIGSLSGIVAK